MSSPPTKEASPWAGGLWRWFAVHLVVAVIAAMPALPAKAATQRAIILEISDAIGPAIADYIVGARKHVGRSLQRLSIFLAMAISALRVALLTA